MKFRIISDEDRSQWMIDNFGCESDGYTGLMVEHNFYDELFELIVGYNGGYFDFIECGNGAKYLYSGYKSSSYTYNEDQSKILVTLNGEEMWMPIAEAMSLAWTRALSKTIDDLVDANDHNHATKIAAIRTACYKLPNELHK